MDCRSLNPVLMVVVGYYCSPHENVTSLPGGIKNKGKLSTVFIKAKIMKLSTPGDQSSGLVHYISI